MARRSREQKRRSEAARKGWETRRENQARAARSAAARLGWQKRKEREAVRSRAARRGWERRREKERRAQERRDRRNAARRRRRAERRLDRLQISPTPPRTRNRGARSRTTGFLPRPPASVVRAYELRAELVAQGYDPDELAVYYVVDGEAERRFTFQAFDRFMSDETYEAVVEAMAEEGEFWVGVSGPDGDLEAPIERVE